jgi:succinyl-CoA synthetase beta subunit
MNALRILETDTQVKGILINIFGGILRCDLLVQSILKAANKFGLKKPIVLRLKGTNFNEVYFNLKFRRKH